MKILTSFVGFPLERIARSSSIRSVVRSNKKIIVCKWFQTIYNSTLCFPCPNFYIIGIGAIRKPPLYVITFYQWFHVKSLQKTPTKKNDNLSLWLDLESRKISAAKHYYTTFHDTSTAVELTVRTSLSFTNCAEPRLRKAIFESRLEYDNTSPSSENQK